MTAGNGASASTGAGDASSPTDDGNLYTDGTVPADADLDTQDDTHGAVSDEDTDETA